MMRHIPTPEEVHKKFVVTHLSVLICRDEYDDKFINKCIDYTKKLLDGIHTVYDVPNDVYETVIMFYKLNTDIFTETNNSLIYKNILKELEK